MGIFRRSLQVLLLVATLLIGAAAAAIVLTQTAWFRDWARGLIVSQGNRYLDGTLSIDRLGGNLFFGVELENVRVEQRGERVISVRNAGVDYSIIQLLTGDVVIDHLRLDEPRVVLRRENGRLNLGALVKRERREKERTGPGRSVSIGEIGISGGTIRVEEGVVGTSGTAVPQVFDKVDASIGFEYEPVRYTVRIGHLSFRGEAPDFDLNSLSGEVSQRDDDLYLDDVAVRTGESSLRLDGRIVNYLSEPTLEIEASSDKLVIPEIARLVPALRGIDLQPSFRLTARGPLDGVAFDFSTRSQAGEASGQVTAGLRGPDRRIKGRVQLGAFDLAPVVKNAAARSRITGIANIDLVLPGEKARGPVVGTFDATAKSVEIAGYRAQDVRARGRVDGVKVRLAEARARAYGGYVVTAGLVDPGTGPGRAADRLLLDLRGRVSDLDLRRLPPSLKVPRVESRLAADYHVAGPLASLRGEATLRRSSLAGATLADGTKASFALAGPATAYAADGAVEALDLQRVGREFRIEALQHERFSGGEVNGSFNVKGSGTKLPDLSLEAAASLRDSSLSGARFPAMNVGAHIEAGRGRFTADGEFNGLDPARVSGRKELAGEVNGRAKVEATIAALGEPVTPESVSATGQVELRPSKVGTIAIEAARVDGDYRNATANLRDVTIEGPDLEVRATGVLALGNQGASNLRYSLNTPDLGVVGRLVNQPLKGTLSVEGEVSGNRGELRTAGRLKGSNVGRGDDSALSLESEYDVRVPNLDASAATVTASPRLAFVRVAGQEITRLDAKATYSKRELELQADAQQAQRQARVGGRLVLHPDHQEVHLTSFGLTTQGLEWTLAPGTEAAVQYGADRIQLDGVQLVSGPQRLEVNGTIGKNDSHLRAAFSDIDISRLDTLIIGDRRFGGRLNASAVVTGPRDALRVDGEFVVDRGAFRSFRYESLGGKVGYSSQGLALDVRLQQGPQSWLAARGTLPTALFRPAAAGGAPAPDAAVPVDFTVNSSSIDLGLVQGFTSVITEVTGTLQADVRVTGTAQDPHMQGFVDVSGGTFTVPSTTVSYRELNGRIALEKDRAVIERLGVADEHGKRLDVAGEVAVHERALGNLKLTVTGDDFEVLHGDLGHLSFDANLAVAGELRRLRITGELEAEKGQVAVDELLELVGSGAYSTTPATRIEDEAAEAAPAIAPVPPLGAGTATAGAPSSGSGSAPERNVSAAKAGTRAAGAPGVAVPAAGQQQAEAESGPPPPQPGFFDAAEIDVRVRVPDTLIVQGRDIRLPGGAPIGLGDVNATFGGEVRAQKAPGGPVVLVGELRTVRGTYDFQGRRFEIQRDGQIRFEGLAPIDPSLDITAVRVIQGVEARVEVGGTVRKPELTLTSQPPLPEADILSLIVFNQPSNQLGEGQQVSLAQRASALATGFVASKLASSLGKALDLDIFEIEAAPEDYAGQGAAVTVGEQVGQRLFVKLRQGVGAADQRSQLIVEYQLLDFLRLETTFSQGSATRSLLRRVEGTGLDLIFFFSY